MTSRSRGAHERRDIAIPALRLETDADGITWLCADRAGSSTNVLSRAVLEELGGVLAGLEAKPPAGLVLRTRVGYAIQDVAPPAVSEVQETP